MSVASDLPEPLKLLLVFPNSVQRFFSYFASDILSLEGDNIAILDDDNPISLRFSQIEWHVAWRINTIQLSNKVNKKTELWVGFRTDDACYIFKSHEGIPMSNIHKDLEVSDFNEESVKVYQMPWLVLESLIQNLEERIPNNKILAF